MNQRLVFASHCCSTFPVLNEGYSHALKSSVFRCLNCENLCDQIVLSQEKVHDMSALNSYEKWESEQLETLNNGNVVFSEVEELEEQ